MFPVPSYNFQVFINNHKLHKQTRHLWRDMDTFWFLSKGHCCFTISDVWYSILEYTSLVVTLIPRDSKRYRFNGFDRRTRGFCIGMPGRPLFVNSNGPLKASGLVSFYGAMTSIRFLGSPSSTQGWGITLCLQRCRAACKADSRHSYKFNNGHVFGRAPVLMFIVEDLSEAYILLPHTFWTACIC